MGSKKLKNNEAFNGTLNALASIFSSTATFTDKILNDVALPVAKDILQTSQDMYSDLKYNKEYNKAIEELNENLINIGKVIYEKKLIKGDKKITAEYKMIDELINSIK